MDSFPIDPSFVYFYPVHPQLRLSSSRLMAEEGQNVTIVCNASGQPQPKVTWSKAVGSLTKERTSVVKGALTICSDEERRWNISLQSTKYSWVSICRGSTGDILPFAL